MERTMNSIAATASSSPTSPTTFVQADTDTFRDLVQKLTGLAGDSREKLPVTLPTRLSSKLSHPVDPASPRRSPFKLQERRQNLRKLEIKLGLTSHNSSSSHHFSSRKVHRPDSPVRSPVTPLSSESLFFRSSPGTESPEEEKAIAEKGFYLHPILSPLTTPRGSEPPELLTLFPLSSPNQKNQD